MATIHTAPPAAIAYASARVPETAFMAASASRDPSAVVTLNTIVIRATAPANLGDADATTFTGGGAPGGGGVCEVKATTMADVDLSAVGAIEHVIFRAIAFFTEPSEMPPTGITNVRMAWSVGASSSGAVVSNESADPLYATFPIRPDDDAIDVGDPVDATYYVHTGPITTQPNGQPWDQASLNGLINVALRADCTAGSTFDLQVSEIMVEVYGAIGSPGQIIAPRLKLGSDVRRPLKLTKDPH
jgi:hypothetical protein